MAIQPDEQYVLKGKQITDLGTKVSSIGEIASMEDWNALFGTDIPNVDEVEF